MLSRSTLRSLQLSSRQFSSNALPNIAVVLNGCGVYDGTEVTEAISVLIALGGRANVQCFAPDKAQMHVVDHTKGEEMNESRNVLLESARIARGNVKPLTDLTASDYSAVIFPGGFGAAKNLCNFAVAGADMEVDADVSRVVQEFKAANKPQGFCCIAPVIPAKVLKATVTVGSDNTEDPDYPYAGTAGAIDAMGGKHVVKGPAAALVDSENNVVTSAAYMYNGRPDQIFDSVKSMVDNVMQRIEKAN